MKGRQLQRGDALGARLSRRDWLRLGAAGVVAGSSSGWIEALADQAGQDPARRRSCILLWMSGGPSQMDTFDLKPSTRNGGLFREIDTSVPGLRISEHLPKLALQMQHIAPVRSMSTKEGDHARATYLLRTGYLPQGPIRYPTLGSLVSHELGSNDSELPAFVSIAPYRQLRRDAYGPGFLGPRYAPLVVGESTIAPADADSEADADSLAVDNLRPSSGIKPTQFTARLEMLRSLEDRFVARHAAAAAQGHQTAYRRAVRLMQSEAAAAFDLEAEPSALRDAYGRNRFGQGCMMARRLVEHGVPFVEVSLSGVDGNPGLGWDTHVDNFQNVRQLSETLDPAWATLLSDLQDRGLLESTLVVWMGEFGRTPVINANGGRDHFPRAWSTVLSGGGIRGGQSIGSTSTDGAEIHDRPVSVPDLLATVFKALGIDPAKQNQSNIGRPIGLADQDAQPIEEVLA